MVPRSGGVDEIRQRNRVGPARAATTALAASASSSHRHRREFYAVDTANSSTVRKSPLSRRSALLLATAIGGGIAGYSRLRPDAGHEAETVDSGEGGQLQPTSTSERTDTADPETPTQTPVTSYRDAVVDDPFAAYGWLDASRGIADAWRFSVAAMVPAAEFSSKYTLRKTVGGRIETLKRLRVDHENERHVTTRIGNEFDGSTMLVPHRRRSYVNAEGEYVEYVSRRMDVTRERQFREGRANRFSASSVETQLIKVRTAIRQLIDAVRIGEPNVAGSIEIPITGVRDAGSVGVRSDGRGVSVRDVSGLIVFDSCKFERSSQLFGTTSPIALRSITIEGRTADGDDPVTVSVDAKTGAVDVDEPAWIERVRPQEGGSS